jgi:hypothetical protein
MPEVTHLIAITQELLQLRRIGGGNRISVSITISHTIAYAGYLDILFILRNGTHRNNAHRHEQQQEGIASFHTRLFTDFSFKGKENELTWRR